MHLDLERIAFGSVVGVTGATVASGTGRERSQQFNLGEKFDGASHSDDTAKCYPLKVEVHRPGESALAGWQSPLPNKYSRSHGCQ